jgi:hypothetical protein
MTGFRRSARGDGHSVSVHIYRVFLFLFFHHYHHKIPTRGAQLIGRHSFGETPKEPVPQHFSGRLAEAARKRHEPANAWTPPMDRTDLEMARVAVSYYRRAHVLSKRPVPRLQNG